MLEWQFEKISQDYYPRQFEYHPTDESLIFGTLTGEVCSINLETKSIQSLAHLGFTPRDTILGLCWLKTCGNRFISGSGKGRVACVDITDFDHITVEDLPKFDLLTSVHTNCTNSLLLLSGYSQNVSLYDIETKQPVRVFSNIHKDHINISRFCNTSPDIFSTSSFDGTIKTWDIRLPGPPKIDQEQWIPEVPQYDSCGPINTLRCSTGIVTIHFSSDDAFLIASALDNEINQFSFADGRLNFRYNIPSTGLDANFTRAYFSASGRYTLTGACEESTVKVLCSYTGELLETVDIYPKKRDKSLYIQSLRGSPRNDGQFCVLANYHEAPFRELVLATSKLSYSEEEPYLQSEVIEDAFVSSNELEQNGKVVSNEESPLQDITTSLSYMHSHSYLLSLFGLREQVGNLKSLPQNEVDGVDATHIVTLKHYRMLEGTDDSGLKSSFNGYRFIRFLDFLKNIYQKLGNGGTLYVHSYLLYARCPFLLHVYLAQHRGDIPNQLSGEINLTEIVPAADWDLLSLLLDHLYISNSSLTDSIIRYYTLILFFQQRFTTDNERIHFIENLLLYYFPETCQESHDSNVLSCTPEELFEQICEEKSLWRNQKLLIQSFTEILFRLIHLGNIFDLTAFASNCESILLSSLCPFNVIQIVEWGNHFSRATVIECCLKYIANHPDVVIFPDQESMRLHLYYCVPSTNYSSTLRPAFSDILLKVVDLLQQSSVPVFTKEEIKTPKLEQLISNQKLAVGNTAKQESIVALTLCEEMPFVSSRLEVEKGGGEGKRKDKEFVRKTIAVALPKVVGHSALDVENSLIFFGGMNRERYYSLAKLLAYNVAEDRFNWITADASRAPTSANLNFTFRLQKSNSNIIVLLGGKLKEDQTITSSKNKQKKKVTKISSHQLNLIRSFINEESRCSPESTATATANESKATNPKGNGQREKDAAAQFHLDSSRSSNDDGDDETDSNQSKNSNSSTDSIYEFHYSSLTWIRRLVYYKTGISPCLTQNRSIFNAVTTANQTDYDQLKNAFKKRIAQAIVPFYASDIPYRCPKCLFQDRNYVSNCSCILPSVSLKEHDGKERIRESTEIVTWAIQFGGYCTDIETILGDVHLLICQNESKVIEESSSGPAFALSKGEENHKPEYEWMKLPVHRPQNMEPPSVRFGHKSVFVPLKQSSEALFGSSSIGRSSSSQSLAAAVGRIFFFGGTSYQDLTDRLLSLRINSKEMKEQYVIEEDCSWEEIRENSGQPPNRHDHSFTYIAQGNFCILFGGMHSSFSNTAVLNDVWTLHWYFRTIEGITSGEREELVVRWEKVQCNGVPPPCRSRHTATYFPTTPHFAELTAHLQPAHKLTPIAKAAITTGDNLYGSLIIFGGMDESLRENENGEEVFDEKLRDSIIYILKWKLTLKDEYHMMVNGFFWENKLASASKTSSATSRMNESRCSSYLDVDCCPEDYLRPMPCSLSADLRLLYFVSDSKQVEDAKKEEDEELTVNCDEVYNRQLIRTKIQKKIQKKDSKFLVFAPDVKIQIENDEDDALEESFQALSLHQDTVTSVALPSSLSADSLLVQSYSSLLSGRCSVLHRMLGSEMIEGQTKCISLSSRQTNIASFQIFLDYLLSDLLLFFQATRPIDHRSATLLSFSTTKERNIVQEIIGLIEISNFYSMPSLVKKCEGLLLSLITEETVIEILEYAELMNLELLRMTCYHFLFRNININDNEVFTKQIGKESEFITAAKAEAEEVVVEVDEETEKNYLSLILSEGICNEDFRDEAEGFEDRNGENSAKLVQGIANETERNHLVEAFKRASIETKQKFREFSLHRVHVYLLDVWKSQDKAM